MTAGTWKKRKDFKNPGKKMKKEKNKTKKNPKPKPQNLSTVYSTVITS